MVVNPFQQPYIASNDNRTIVGIDCPVCKKRNKAVHFIDVPANQAVRVVVDNELNIHYRSKIELHYGDLTTLPEHLMQDALISYWRCESCEAVFHNAFEGLNQKQLKRQIYNSDFPRTLQQRLFDIPRIRFKFIENLLQEHLQGLDILVCESYDDAVTKEFKKNKIVVDHYNHFTHRLNSLTSNKYDLIYAFSLLERVPNIEKSLKALKLSLKNGGAILVSYYPFDYRNPKDMDSLSPRNGLLRLYSSKAIESTFMAAGLKFVQLTDNAVLLYKKELPHFAKHIMDNLNSNNDNLLSFEQNDEQEEEKNRVSSDQPSETQEDAPVEETFSASTIELQTKRICIRNSRYGKTAYNYLDNLVGQSLHQYGEYLIGDQQLLTQLIRPNWVVFDIAANIGLHCMIMAPLLTEGGSIHAYEPYRDSFRLLGMNMLLNDIDIIDAHHAAIGAETGTTKLLVEDPYNPGNMAAKGWSADYSGKDVPIYALDDIQPERCDFIHVCAPECEINALKGAQKTINQHQPALLVNCVNKTDFQEIFTILNGSGYRMYWHIQPFFDAENLFGNDENVFGNAGAAKILALHSSKNQNVGLTEITSSEDWIA